jgi:glycosyltransferase involved in cell wall biosynthesis
MTTADIAPLVSVIIPTYNRVGYLPQAIESVLRQEHTGPPHELIVIDDGSTDETRRVLELYLSRVRCAYQDHAGLSAARNHGLRLARGEFVLFLDSDDFLLPDALAGLLAQIVDRPDLGAVQGGWRTVDDRGETLCDVELWHRLPRLDLRTWMMATPVFLGGFLCRRTWAERVGGFDTELAQVEDADFALRLAMLGCQCAWLRRVIVGYRQHSGNMTRDAREQVHAAQRVFTRVFERPELPQHIRNMKDEAFYYLNARFAWNLYRMGAVDEVSLYLRRSMDLATGSPQQTVLEWCRMFVGWSRSVGVGMEDLEGLIPHIRSVGNLDDVWWRTFETALPWWVTIWLHYFTEEAPPPTQAWAAQVQRSTPEVLSLAQASLLLTPVEAMLRVIGRFWTDVRAQPLDPPFREPDLVALYLTAFGQAVMARRLQIARRALSQAMQHSRKPAALRAWRRFAAKAMRYAISDSRAPGVGR